MNGYEIAAAVMLAATVVVCLCVVGWVVFLMARDAPRGEGWKPIAVSVGLVLWFSAAMVLAFMGDAVKQGRA